MIKDLTIGNPRKILFLFSVPILLSSIFQQMYNLVDSIIAGRLINEDALASVGASYPVTMIFFGIAFGCNFGASVLISNLFGNKDFVRLKAAISTAFISFMTLSLVLSFFGFIFCDEIIKAIKTPANIFVDSSMYLRLFFIGLPFIFLYNTCTGIFTALGDSKTPLMLLIFSSVGNIILDVVLIVNFNMGVLGLALATVIMQALASVLALIILHKRLKSIECEVAHKLFSGELFSKLVKLSIPNIFQQSFISVGNIFIQSIINNYGSSTIAGYSAATKLNTFALVCFGTSGTALSNFVAQNMGAGKMDRLKSGLKSALVMGGAIAVTFSLIFLIFNKQMIELFLDVPTSQSLEVGRTFIKFVAPFYCVVTIKLTVDGLLRGSGAIWQFSICTFTDLIVRVLLCYALQSLFEYNAIPVAWIAGWILGTAASVGFYFLGRWKKSVI